MRKRNGLDFQNPGTGCSSPEPGPWGDGGGQSPLPFVFSLPHCSGRVPETIRRAIALTNEAIEDSTDIGTSEIFGSVPARAILRASWSRLVVDLNRSSLDRGPKGAIAEVDYHGRSVYKAGLVPKEKEIEQRLKEYYFPFHDRLKEALADPGAKGLFDCHSLCGIGPSEAPDKGIQRKDIILGNNGDGRGNVNLALGNTTCPVEILDFMKKAFQRAGFSVNINYPYSGGFIVTHYAREFAAKGKFFVQIEINQDLFQGSAPGQWAEEKLKDVKARVTRSLEEMAKAFCE